MRETNKNISQSEVQDDFPSMALCENKCEKPELVYPLDWEEIGRNHWEVKLFCPNCEYCTNGIYSQDEVEAFDLELDRGTEALKIELRRMIHANTEEEIGRFVAALEVDAVLPEDFGRPA